MVLCIEQLLQSRLIVCLCIGQLLQSRLIVCPCIGRACAAQADYVSLHWIAGALHGPHVARGGAWMRGAAEAATTGGISGWAACCEWQR